MPPSTGDKHCLSWTMKDLKLKKSSKGKEKKQIECSLHLSEFSFHMYSSRIVTIIVRKSLWSDYGKTCEGSSTCSITSITTYMSANCMANHRKNTTESPTALHLYKRVWLVFSQGLLTQQSNGLVDTMNLAAWKQFFLVYKDLVPNARLLPGNSWGLEKCEKIQIGSQHIAFHLQVCILQAKKVAVF